MFLAPGDLPNSPACVSKCYKTGLYIWGNAPIALWICSLLFVLLTCLFLYTPHVNALDAAISTLIDIKRTPLLTSFFHSITVLGHPLVIVGVLSVCSGWFIKKKMKRVAQWLLWSSVIATVVSLLVKALVGRVRPSLAVFLEIGGSFPSFHATISLTAYGLLFYILASFYKKQRCLLLSLGVFFVVLISFSRIYLNVHYFSDVVGGLLLGMSAIILVKFQQDSTRIN